MTIGGGLNRWSLVESTPAPFESEGFHLAMLRNYDKYAALAGALSSCVKGVKVLDIGCGSGVIALLASQMGASEVTAIERPTVSGLTKEVFEAFPSLSSRITLIEKDFFAADPVGQFDVVISETVGYLGFEENLWAIMAHAAERWAHTSTVFLPGSLSIRPSPVLLSASSMASNSVLDSSACHRISVESLSPPCSVILSSSVPAVIELEWRLQPRGRISINGFSFSVSASLSTAGLQIGNWESAKHWPRCVVPLPEMLTVDEGQQIRLLYRCEPSPPACLVQLSLCVRGRKDIRASLMTDAAQWPSRSVTTTWPTGLVAAVRGVLDASPQHSP